MAKSSAFDENALRYDEWFEKNKACYESELEAVGRALPEEGAGVEIGVGTGRFASRLGIKAGVEPSEKMRELARERGIEAIDGVAEKLPFGDKTFDFILMVTVICFLDDMEEAFKEAYRVLKENGHLVIGFIDKDSPLGREYGLKKSVSPFYRDARFYSADEVASFLKKAGFSVLSFAQTIFRRPEEIREREPVVEGCGEGLFVVIKAGKGGGYEQGR